MNHARFLHQNGYVIIDDPLFSHPDAVAYWRGRMEEELCRFPEFKKHPRLHEIRKDIVAGQTNRYCIGGTSFLGNPSVFHNLLSRELRELLTFVVVQEVLRDYKQQYLSPEYKLETLMERILCRPAGDVATKESWHRDMSPAGKPTDLIIGGWLNLDHQSQHLSCIPGSHFPEKDPQGRGFHKLDPAKTKEYNANKFLVEVKPGQILLMIQEIIHEVLTNAAARRDFTSLRQFLGFRLTTSDEPLNGSKYLRDAIQRQSVMRIKSDQYPALYPAAANMWPLQRERKFIFLEEMVCGNQAYIDSKKRNFVSLQEMEEKSNGEIRRYPQYEEHEVELLQPTKRKRVLSPYTRTRETIEL